MTCFNFIKKTLVDEYNRIQEQLNYNSGSSSIYNSVLSQFGIGNAPVYADDAAAKSSKKKKEAPSIADKVNTVSISKDTAEAEDIGEYDNIDE